MLAFLLDSFINIISGAGYAGLALLMMLESMIAPVPSEAVMPFAGFLIWEGRMAWLPVVFSSTLGSIAGSLLSYWIGMRYGREIVLAYGRYLLLNEHHLHLTENFFRRFGPKAIFFSRFIPIVRHFISLPAGAARMDLRRFFLYTALGAGIWNFFLAYLGFSLGDQWGMIRSCSEKLDLLVGALLVGLVVRFIYRSRQDKRTR